MIGGVGVGEFESFDAVRSFWRVMGTVQPNPDNVKVYERYLKVFNQAYDALTGVFTSLSALKS